MRKLYSKPKAKVVRTDSGWSKRESMVALCSIIVAAIGSMASAFSTFFAWQQLDILSRERMTPYRAILYSAKVDSYQKVIERSIKMRSALLTFTIEIDTHIGTEKKKSSRNRGENEYVLTDLNSLPSSIFDAAAYYLEERDSYSYFMEQQSPLWDDETVQQIEAIDEGLWPLRHCAVAIVNARQYLGRGSNKVSRTGFDQHDAIRAIQSFCFDEKDLTLGGDTTDKMDILYSRMKSNLKSDQLQDIESK